MGTAKCVLLVCLTCFAATQTAGSFGQAPAALAPPPRAEKLEVMADGHPLTVWAKRPASPRGAILLVHGRTWSALPNFDLKVEGHQRSVMDALFLRGYATYALDQRGYGASPRDASGWLTPTRAAKDVSIVLAWIRARESRPGDRPILVGYSRGSLTSLLAAQLYPDSLSKLVLYGFLRDLDEKFPITEAPPLPPRERTTPAMAASDFVVRGAAPREVIDSYVRQALAADPVRVDWRDEHEFSNLDPTEVHVPTLIIRGTSDPRTTTEKDLRLLSRLGSEDRSLVILPSSDHAAHVEDVQPAWVDAIVTFIERPRLTMTVVPCEDDSMPAPKALKLPTPGFASSAAARCCADTGGASPSTDCAQRTSTAINSVAPGMVCW
jgi:alpha-beta hydrolase superfamily lysophospholipase